VQTLFFFNLGTTQLILFHSFLAQLFLVLGCLLAFKFVLFKSSLSLQLFSFASQTLLFKLSSTFFFSSLVGEQSALFCFLFEAEALRFFFLKTESLFAFELLFA